MRISFLVVAVVSVSAVSVALGAPSPQLYVGSARSLILTGSEAKYSAVTSSKAVNTPSAAKRRGFRSGWETNYRDTASAAAVNEADLLIYVYDSTADAFRAYRNACPTGCVTQRSPHGIKLKYLAKTFHSLPTVSAIATCNNLYLAVITTSTTETSRQLAYDTGYLVGAVYAKATKRGMGTCR